jgi:hypothetical protein
MKCGFAVIFDFTGARIIEHGAESSAAKWALLCVLRGNFANFAVKIFNRGGRKGVAEFAKDSIHPSGVTVLCFSVLR